MNSSKVNDKLVALSRRRKMYTANSIHNGLGYNSSSPNCKMLEAKELIYSRLQHVSTHTYDIKFKQESLQSHSN